MTIATIFLLLSFCFLIALIYCLNLLIFYQKEYKRFLGAENGEAYWEYLQNREQNLRGKRKKNLLLHFRYQSYLAFGEQEKARQIFPFLKKDRFFDLSGK